MPQLKPALFKCDASALVSLAKRVEYPFAIAKRTGRGR
jgi:hypothetical protein